MAEATAEQDLIQTPRSKAQRSSRLPLERPIFAGAHQDQRRISGREPLKERPLRQTRTGQAVQEPRKETERERENSATLGLRN